MATKTTKTTNATVSQINISTQKATVEAQYTALKAGIMSPDFNDVTSVMIGKKVYTKAELAAEVQAVLDAVEKTKADRTTLHASVGEEKATRARVGPVRAGFKQFLYSRYGKNAPELQKFGFTPAKVPQKSVAAKAAGVAQAKATRTARSTMGKKQKLDVTASEVTLSRAVPSPAPAPAPAQTAAPAPAAHGTPAGGAQ
jgi:hypothetical protein